MNRRLRKSGHTNRIRRLRSQRLERRELMAADVTMLDGVLAINGTSGDDIAEVYTQDDQVLVSLTTFNEAGEVASEQSGSFAREDVSHIVFQAGDGDDLFVNDSNIDSVTRSGGGNDTVLSGGGNDILATGTGNDFVIGGGGDDVILDGPGDDIIVPTADFTNTETDSEEESAEDDSPPANDETIADDQTEEDSDGGADSEEALDDSNPTDSDDAEVDNDPELDSGTDESDVDVDVDPSSEERNGHIGRGTT